MTILLDLDSTVFDTAASLYRLWQKRRLGPCDQSRWDWGNPTAMAAALDELYGRGYRQVGIYPHAETVIAQLYMNDHRLHFVSARPPEHYLATAVCLEAAHILSFGQLHCCGEQSKLDIARRLRADVLLDDRARTCVEAHELGQSVIVYDQPWNRFLTLPRASGWANDEGVGAMLGAPVYARRKRQVTASEGKALPPARATGEVDEPA